MCSIESVTFVYAWAGLEKRNIQSVPVIENELRPSRIKRFYADLKWNDKANTVQLPNGKTCALSLLTGNNEDLAG